MLLYDTFVKIRLSRDQVKKLDSSLVFSGSTVPIEGVIQFSLIAGWVSRQRIAQINFLVIKILSAYNAILGWSKLNALHAIVSTYHLLVKFPTCNGVGEVRGNQV